ncbi:uncharacterized protein K460DRAFT_401700 [Cucurbitaria berberidis CBS 394.84]|uniref:Uncharacterized protein n=1 Tax=Cucurbitaria berberidis CBS 394.84 TaxID=1168544 RepID=A0A9P4GUR3_9PLEO|nr:uncharacterized protein K460DRAFT_401700 [Cucurbitaria berberidis CBS 394.84]KAF1851682.1 hypothetical protein K460DRAFT_401700 [Cucurbitaria berberidis CBS 394.84]
MTVQEEVAPRRKARIAQFAESADDSFDDQENRPGSADSQILFQKPYVRPKKAEEQHLPERTKVRKLSNDNKKPVDDFRMSLWDEALMLGMKEEDAKSTDPKADLQRMKAEQARRKAKDAAAKVDANKKARRAMNSEWFLG